MTPEELTDVRCQLRWLKRYTAGSMIVLAAIAFTALQPAPDRSRSFETLEAERIDIVGADGTRRLVLSNRERFPDPVLDGDTLERSIDPAGLVFYDRDGDETGGLGVVDIEGRARRSLFILDYRNSEAIGYSAGENLETDAYSAGIAIADRVPLDADIREVGSAGTRRIQIQNRNGDARIVLNDAEGNPRIRLFVEADGEAGIELLNAEGEVVGRPGEEEG